MSGSRAGARSASASAPRTGTRGRCARTEATIARRRHRGRGQARRRQKNRARRLRYLRIQARRLARRVGLRPIQKWQPWWVTHRTELVELEAGIPPEYQHFEKVVIGRALVYRGAVSLDPLPRTRRIAVVLNGPPSTAWPEVMADGPRTDRHRFKTYRPLPLCLWYKHDPPGQQWRLADGLVGLIDITRVHLFREDRFRATGRWPGPEVHLDDQKVPKNRALRRALDRAGPRIKCWCSSGRRYMRCHGGVTEERELAALGLLQADERRLAEAA